MITAEQLHRCSLKDLEKLAKAHGVHGWHGMRKEQLVKALLKSHRSGPTRRNKPSRRNKSVRKSGARAARPSASTASRKTLTATAKRPAPKVAAAKLTASKLVNTKPPATKSAGKPKPAVGVNARVDAAAKPAPSEKIRALVTQHDRMKNLSLNVPADVALRDRLVALVRDPYWLQVYWDVTRQSVQRAEAALGHEWHAAIPVLRLLEVGGSGETTSAEKVIRDIRVHGGVNTWFVEVHDPPKTFRLDIGYLSPTGRFFVLARSNIVTTPRAGASDALDSNWHEVTENYDKIFALTGGNNKDGVPAEVQQLFEERLRRPMSSSVFAGGSQPNGTERRKGKFKFDVDAELIVYGTTESDAVVTLQGEPVRVRPDGTFTVRFSMPNCRQVIPAVASNIDGSEQRTVVLAVERNTKVMEPVVRDGHE